MKKIYFILVLAISLLVFTGCAHKHTFSNANCTTPKTCTSCGETEGRALGHQWNNATCMAAKTCTDCGKTEGTKIDHDTTNGKCSMCGLDYFETLKNLLKTEGFEDVGSTSNDYRYHVEEGEYTFNLSLRKNGPIAFNVVKEKGSNGFVTFEVTFDKVNVKNQKYDWLYDYFAMTSSSVTYEKISGQLYAPDFSQYTSALTYSNSTVPSSSTANEFAGDAAKMLKFALEQIKIFMENGDQDITLANFGFEHFE